MHYAPNAIQMPDGRWEGCWFVDFTLKPNDPRMRLYQQGLASEPPKERVWFFRRERGGQLVPLDILQMGVSGVTEFLERGDTWSGRGEYSSIEDAYRKTEEANARFKERKFEEARQDAIDRAMDKRRTWLKIPFLRVGKDLRGERKG